MVHGMLGEKVFMTGLINYLNDFAYQSAVTRDVFDELTSAAHAAGLNLNVTEIMREWTEQPGYPLVSCATRPNGGVTTWTCSQQRFFSFSGAPASSQSWTIWLSADTPSTVRPAFPIVWPASSRSITFDVQGGGWVKLNANNTAFMRVMYDNSTWASFSKALNSPGFGGIHHDDRLGLVNDAFTFLQQKLLSVQQVLDLALFLQYDTSFPVRQVAQPAFSAIYSRIKYHNSTAGLLFAQYWNQSLTAIGRTLNVSNVNPAADQILESVVGPQLVQWNTAGLGDVMLSQWNDLQAGNGSFASVSPNRRDLLLIAATTLQDQYAFGWSNVFYEVYLQKWTGSNDSEQDDDPLAPLGFPQIITALTASTDDQALDELVSYLTEPSLVAPQHLLLFLAGLAGNAKGLSRFNFWIMSQQQLQQPPPPCSQRAQLCVCRRSPSRCCLFDRRGQLGVPAEGRQRERPRPAAVLRDEPADEPARHRRAVRRLLHRADADPCAAHCPWVGLRQRADQRCLAAGRAAGAHSLPRVRHLAHQQLSGLLLALSTTRRRLRVLPPLPAALSQCEAAVWSARVQPLVVLNENVLCSAASTVAAHNSSASSALSGSRAGSLLCTAPTPARMRRRRLRPAGRL